MDNIFTCTDINIVIVEKRFLSSEKICLPKKMSHLIKSNRSFHLDEIIQTKYTVSVHRINISYFFRYLFPSVYICVSLLRNTILTRDFHKSAYTTSRAQSERILAGHLSRTDIIFKENALLSRDRAGPFPSTVYTHCAT